MTAAWNSNFVELVKEHFKLNPSKPVPPPAPNLAALAREALADGVKITRLPEGFARGAHQTRWPSLVGSML